MTMINPNDVVIRSLRPAKTRIVIPGTIISGGGGSESPASETVAGIAEIATQAETNTGTDDARIVTPLKFQTRLAAYAQPLDSDLTAIAALTTTAYGRAVLELANQAALMGLLSAATESASGIAEIATQAETNTGTDDARFVTPLKLQTRLAAFAQPLDSDLTAIAALSTTSYGRALLTLADQAALLTAIGSSSTTASGVVELATSAETITGTDTARAVTPAGGAAAYQPLDADLTAFAAKTAPTGAVVGTSDSQTLTNKTISGADNTLSNISADSTIDGATNHVFTAADDTKLAGIAAGATDDTTVNAHIADATDAHDASAISFVPAGSIAATNVQAAIEEVAAEAGGGSGTVDTIVPGNNIDVDATDPANPIVSVETLTLADVSDVTASAAEVNLLDGVTASTAELNILDGVTATAAELNALDGITATVTELNYTDGVTSAIQTQLDTGATNLSNHLSDAVDAHDASAISFDETVEGWTSATTVQAALDEAGTVAAAANSDLQNAMTKNGGGQETVAAASGTSGTVTLSCNAASVFTLTPTGNVTTLTISNVPGSAACTISLIVSQGATPRTIATPTGGVFIGAATPTQVANKICVFTYLTVDGGTTWICSAAVQV